MSLDASMKEIDLQKPHTVSITINLQDLFEPNKSLGRVEFHESQESEKMPQLNGGKILYAATEIGKSIDRIISDALFGASTIPSDQKNFFLSEIMQSSNLSF